MLSTSLNVALLVNDTHVPEWQYQLIQQVMATSRIQLRLVIIDSTARQQNDTLLHCGLSLVRTAERLLSGTPLNPLKRRTLRPLYRPEIVYDLADKHLAAQCAKYGIDVVLQLGPCTDPPGWLCKASRYGVWGMFAGGMAESFDLSTGLREYVAGADQLYSGIVVKRSQEVGDLHSNSHERISPPSMQVCDLHSKQCLLLTSGSIHPAFLHRTLEPVLWKMLALVLQLLVQLRDSNDSEAFLAERGQRYRSRVDELELSALRPAADWSLLCKALARSLGAKSKLLYKKIFRPHTWGLLYGEQDQIDAPMDLEAKSQACLLEDEIFARRLQPLMPPPDKFWADPQLVSYQQRCFVFFEEWVDAQQKGRIVCAEWYGDDQFSTVVPVLEQSYHLSYPHVFIFSGSYYMVPESAENKTISLYRCIRFPDRWELVHHLMEGVEAYDATLCEHEGRWWMFVNIRHHPNSSSDDLLYLYSADSPLSQHWQSHPANPIVSEVASARPAGKILRLGDRLYRPSQNCAGSYGRGLNLNQIIRWNSVTYQECTLGQYVPDGKAGRYGVHTFSMLGHSILSDAIVRQPRRKLKPWRWMNNNK